MTQTTNEMLDRVAKQIPYVKAWLAAVEAEIKREIEGGAEFKNVKLVPTDPRRNWTLGPAELIKLLKRFSRLPLDVVAPRSPLSPAQAEKTLGRKVYINDLSEYVVSTSSGTKLAYIDSETEKD